MKKGFFYFIGSVSAGGKLLADNVRGTYSIKHERSLFSWNGTLDAGSAQVAKALVMAGSIEIFMFGGSPTKAIAVRADGGESTVDFYGKGPAPP